MPPPAAFDYYEALEIERTATNEEIKSSYRRLARIHHPDKNLDNPEATAAFQKVNRTLSKRTSPTASKKICTNVADQCRFKLPTKHYLTNAPVPFTTPARLVPPTVHQLAAAPSTTTPKATMVTTPTTSMRLPSRIFCALVTAQLVILLTSSEVEESTLMVTMATTVLRHE
jgi:hypothetical protein